MRPPQYTLTPAHVQAHASVRLQKYLGLKDHGPKCRADTLWTVLCYAACRIISLAAVSSVATCVASVASMGVRRCCMPLAGRCVRRRTPG